MTSDDFFGLSGLRETLVAIDLGYIDGMHQIEYALRDWMNIERHCHPGSVVIIDDIYPAHPLQGARRRQSRHWTGDVWKLIPILETYRKDLVLLPVDTFPTGSLLVFKADPENRVLWDRFDEIVEEAIHRMPVVPDRIVNRVDKVDPLDPRLTRLFRDLRAAREARVHRRAG